jgi:hypothetical protein
LTKNLNNFLEKLMNPLSVEQLQSGIIGKKVVVLDAAAWAMTICTVTGVTSDSGGLILSAEGGDKDKFSLEAPVEIFKTETGFQLKTEKLVLNVDLLPE